MQVVSTIAAVRAAQHAQIGTWGLVPTMGFLHEGHLSLVRRAKAENTFAAVSIFVNPMQFGPQEDLARYPRDLPRDLQLLLSAGTDLVFTPAPEEVYPPGFQTQIDLGAVTTPLEGARRPGHFRGVATVVAKLFNIFQPTKAYFGAKDAQQVVVIQRMVRDLDFPVEVIVCPTAREVDGLARSSRNIYLEGPTRAAAPVLYRALTTAQAAWAAGERDATHLRTIMHECLAAEPLAHTDYISVADRSTLAELEYVGPEGALFSLAVRVGQARLIDNLSVGPDL